MPSGTVELPCCDTVSQQFGQLQRCGTCPWPQTGRPATVALLILPMTLCSAALRQRKACRSPLEPPCRQCHGRHRNARQNNKTHGAQCFSPQRRPCLSPAAAAVVHLSPDVTSSPPYRDCVTPAGSVWSDRASVPNHARFLLQAMGARPGPWRRLNAGAA
jgi:hypothetical protein